jgi:RNA polymerase sigma-70 factor (ECF subfamily)
LRRFLIARTGSEADGDDLLSELWIKVNSASPGPVANVKSYLFTMANNLVLDRLREARRRERRELDWTAERHGDLHVAEVADASPSAEELLSNQQECRRLSEAIAQLPAGARRVLLLHKIEGASHGEIAVQLGITRSAVEKHMAVAMTHLRRLLEAEAPQPRRRLSSRGGPPTLETGAKK